MVLFDCWAQLPRRGPQFLHARPSLYTVAGGGVRARPRQHAPSSHPQRTTHMHMTTRRRSPLRPPPPPPVRTVSTSSLAVVSACHRTPSLFARSNSRTTASSGRGSVGCSNRVTRVRRCSPVSKIGARVQVGGPRFPDKHRPRHLRLLHLIHLLRAAAEAEEGGVDGQLRARVVVHRAAVVGRPGALRHAHA